VYVHNAAMHQRIEDIDQVTRLSAEGSLATRALAGLTESVGDSIVTM